MPASLRFIPGTTIRWRVRRFVIVDYAGLDALVAREIGKRRLHRVPLNEALVDLTPGDRNAWTPDLVSVENKAWQIAVSLVSCRLLAPHFPCPVPRPVSIPLAFAFIGEKR